MNTQAYTTAQLQTIKQTLQALEPKQAQAKPARKTNNTEKIAQAKQLWETVQKDGLDSAVQQTGKSKHYVKLIALAYDLYRQSKKIRTAYDKGQITWSTLYDFAFRFKKNDTLSTVEARLSA